MWKILWNIGDMMNDGLIVVLLSIGVALPIAIFIWIFWLKKLL